MHGPGLPNEHGHVHRASLEYLSQISAQPNQRASKDQRMDFARWPDRALGLLKFLILPSVPKHAILRPFDLTSGIEVCCNRCVLCLRTPRTTRTTCKLN